MKKIEITRQTTESLSIQDSSSPEKLRKTTRLSIIRQLLQFLAEEKKYWLIPLVILLIVIGLLVVFMQVVAPFFYPLV